MNVYMNEAIKEAIKSYKKGDVPVGAVIVRNNKIIARAHNLKENKNNPLLHAEIIAINKAAKKLKRWRLEDCELYVTMEPCLMCTGAIIQSRIKKIYFSIENKDFGALKNISQEKKYGLIINEGIESSKSIELIRNFFGERRKK